MSFRAQEGFCEDSYLLLDANSFKGVNPETLEVFLNNRKLDLLKIEEVFRKKRYHFECSGFDTSQGAIFTLTLRADKVESSQVTAPRNDARTLGFGLTRLEFISR